MRLTLACGAPPDGHRCGWCDGFTLVYIQGVCDPSQGTVNFMLFGLLDRSLQKEIRALVRRTHRRLCAWWSGSLLGHCYSASLNRGNFGGASDAPTEDHFEAWKSQANPLSEAIRRSEAEARTPPPSPAGLPSTAPPSVAAKLESERLSQMGPMARAAVEAGHAPHSSNGAQPQPKKSALKASRMMGNAAIARHSPKDHASGIARLSRSGKPLSLRRSAAGYSDEDSDESDNEAGPERQWIAMVTSKKVLEPAFD